MKNLKNKIKNMKGITLISLVVTIIILIILAGISISLMLGNNGILNRSKTASEEYKKQSATEMMNLKITTCQMQSYTENGKLPTLAYLAAFLQNDKETTGDIAYVEMQSQKQASLDETPYTTWDKIYTRLSAYPYEFEINSSLQLASIDGVKVATVPANDDDTIVSMTKAELDNYIETAITAKLQNYSQKTSIDNGYQKLRSDSFENVSFTHGSKYIAPCDGYYFAAWQTSTTVGNTMCWVDHYLANDTLISRSGGTCKDYDRSGCEIYLKKGEYLILNKQENATVATSKFFYAVGCQPD